MALPEGKKQQSGQIGVTQILTRLRYNKPDMLAILGGMKVMIESPLIKELVAEKLHAGILSILDTRFGPVPKAVAVKLKRITEEPQLMQLLNQAAVCPDLAAFRKHLAR